MRPALEYIHNVSGNNFLIGAEVGVRNGENAVSMLTKMNISRIFLIDNFLPYPDGQFGERTQTEQDRYYVDMVKNLQPYYDRAVFITHRSLFAATLFSDELFDFIYIDANHAYEYVLADILAWWPKVKKGGFLCGHDYTGWGFIGVKQAVDKFILERKLKLINLDGPEDWAIEKEKT